MEAIIAESLDQPPSSERYFNHRRGKLHSRRTLNHRVRTAAKAYTEEYPGEVPCRTHAGFQCALALRGPYDIPIRKAQRLQFEKDRQDPTRLRHHAERDLRYASQFAHPEPISRERNYIRSRPRWGSDENDGIALARSRDPLPSDRHRQLQRTPSLEREEAFCDSTTFKGKVSVKALTRAPFDEDEQIADLYRMGLLYDDGAQPYQCGGDAIFNLNDIHHDEPVYSIRTSRRGRKMSGREHHVYDGSLPLDLSFADLANDHVLAQYLNPQPDSTTGEDSLQQLSCQQTSAPLRVIYELATAHPSFDFDTSQAPDLLNDSLSDYDYLSDSELDDSSNNSIPSQREVYDAATAAPNSGPWVLLGDDS